MLRFLAISTLLALLVLGCVPPGREFGAEGLSSTASTGPAGSGTANPSAVSSSAVSSSAGGPVAPNADTGNAASSGGEAPDGAGTEGPDGGAEPNDGGSESSGGEGPEDASVESNNDGSVSSEGGVATSTSSPPNASSLVTSTSSAGAVACAPADCPRITTLAVNGQLTPAFDPSITDYAIKLPLFAQNLVLSASLSPGATLASNGAAITAQPWSSAALDLGETQFELVVQDPVEGSTTYQLTVTRGAPTELYIKASNTGMDDNFGNSVALSADGNTLAVGAYGESSAGSDQSDNGATAAGAVYVFTRNPSGVWSQQAYIKASNAEAGDHFGDSIALSADGSTLAVTADEEASAGTGIGNGESDNSANYAGAVYLFSRSSRGAWNQAAYVKASNTEAGDSFGESLALSADGNTLAVGTTQEDSAAKGIGGDQADNSASIAGAVYVFARSPSGPWAQQTYVKASNTEAEDAFGYSIALSADGNTLAVGAIGESSAITGVGGTQLDNSALSSGAVYVFTRNTNSIWSQQAYIKASNTESNDGFGFRVSLSGDGDTLAVSSQNESSASQGINGDQTDNSAGYSGAAYVFTRNNVTWNQQAYIKASNAGTGEGFGRSLALNTDGNTLAVGAFAERSAGTGFDADPTDKSTPFAGAAYVFVRSGGADWRQRAYIKATNTAFVDYFGGAVALSGDGNTVAAGAIGEASASTGIGGDPDDNSSVHAGAVYVIQ